MGEAKRRREAAARGDVEEPGRLDVVPGMFIQPGPVAFIVQEIDAPVEPSLIFHVESSTGMFAVPITCDMADQIAAELTEAARRKRSGIVTPARPSLIVPGQ